MDGLLLPSPTDRPEKRRPCGFCGGFFDDPLERIVGSDLVPVDKRTFLAKQPEIPHLLRGNLCSFQELGCLPRTKPGHHAAKTLFL
jgi:hypothetical protein